MSYLVKNLSTDPYFNLASEEYFLDHFDGDLILLWRNGKTVVVGRNQNTWEEINTEYVKDHQIAVVRRLTGGGAVFHDLGNVNYTVILKDQKGLFSDYAYFTKPVCEFLRTLGVNAELSGRNDLLIDGMKFCGNAQTRRGGKIMHHGCIMFSSDVEDLSGALRPNPVKLESKGVKSVRSRVTNVASHLKQAMTPEEFFEQLYEYFKVNGEKICCYEMSEVDRQEISRLAQKKYASWDWNYGKSPAYTVQMAKKFPFGFVDVRLTIEKGIIVSARIFGDFFGVREVSELEHLLIGIRREEDALRDVCERNEISQYISGMTSQEFSRLTTGSFE